MADTSPTDPRFVRFRCPLCGATSEPCDQQEDVHRLSLGNWWWKHQADYHRPAPIIEAVDPADVPRA